MKKARLPLRCGYCGRVCGYYEPDKVTLSRSNCIFCSADCKEFARIVSDLRSRGKM